MDDTKREELEKACKNYKVRTRMVAVRMVRVRNMSVEETADIRVRRPHGSATGCAAATKEALKASGTFPDAGGLEELPETP